MMDGDNSVQILEDAVQIAGVSDVLQSDRQIWRRVAVLETGKFPE
jgi:hypothetical protein